MLAPLQTNDPAPDNAFESLLATARLEALTTLRRLLTDPPESPGAARELRMAATAILRISPCLDEPRAPARGHVSDLNEPRAPARGHVSDLNEPRAPARGTASASDETHQTANDAPEVASPASIPIPGSISQSTGRRPSRRDRRAAAALRARSGLANTTQDSG